MLPYRDNLPIYRKSATAGILSLMSGLNSCCIIASCQVTIHRRWCWLLGKNTKYFNKPMPVRTSCVLNYSSRLQQLKHVRQSLGIHVNTNFELVARPLMTRTSTGSHSLIKRFEKGQETETHPEPNIHRNCLARQLSVLFTMVPRKYEKTYKQARHSSNICTCKQHFVIHTKHVLMPAIDSAGDEYLCTSR